MTVTIKAKALEAFVADIFASAGCSQEEGGRIGRYLVSANLSGHDSHGVVRVPRYAIQKKNGTVVADSARLAALHRMLRTDYTATLAFDDPVAGPFHRLRRAPNR